MRKVKTHKRNYSALTLEEAMQLIPAEDFQPWRIVAPLRPPSDILLANLRRLESFELSGSEAAKVMLMDTLLAEIVPDYPNLKVWKEVPLEADKVAGIADYLIAPRRAYVATPLLCVVEAKRDDFDSGAIQCVAEMYACLWNNQQRGQGVDVYGIVSNGQGWQFYKLSQAAEVFETELLAISDMPKLLGALNFVFGECAKNAD